MKLTDAVVDAAAISIANKTMAGGAGAGLIGWLMEVNWLGVGGLLVAIIGLVAQIYFHLRRDRREARESQARIEQMRRGER